MKKRTVDALLVSVVAGLVAGCHHVEAGTPRTAFDDEMPGDAFDKNALSRMQEPGGDKDCCKGKNECKGKGNCKTDAHDCAGMNECKGQGGCKPADCK